MHATLILLKYNAKFKFHVTIGAVALFQPPFLGVVQKSHNFSTISFMCISHISKVGVMNITSFSISSSDYDVCLDLSLDSVSS